MIDPASPTVAVVGVGVMGSAIATRLLETGARVAIFDRDPAKMQALAQEGARAAASAADAARNAPFVVTSLNSAEIVEAAVFGPEGVAAAAGADTLLIDMSSIDPDSTRRLAKRFHGATEGRWIDCPLSGGAPGALAGRLTVMAGGDPSDFERARAVMSRLTANYTLMGPIGAGQATKLVNQVLCAIQFQAVAEAVALAERAGVAAERIPAALAGGRATRASCRSSEPRWPAAIFRRPAGSTTCSRTSTACRRWRTRPRSSFRRLRSSRRSTGPSSPPASAGPTTRN